MLVFNAGLLALATKLCSRPRVLPRNLFVVFFIVIIVINFRENK